jgi:general secretion pathway protein L
MVREFLTWWLGQLADLIPEQWRRFGSPSGDAMVITPIGPVSSGVASITVSLRRNGRETPLGRCGLTPGALSEVLRPAGKPAVLRLAETDVLCKTVTLPLAAERGLDRVMAFEMDRETPFSLHEIFWNHRIVRRDHERGQLSVRLVLIPRSSLAALLDALAKAGIAPKRAEIGAGPDQGCYLPLNGNGGLHDAAARGLLRWPAVAACAGLALAAAVTPFVQQARTLAAFDREIAASRAAVAEADKLRKEIERLSSTVELIDSERDKAGRPLATLAAVTRMIPDDTFLSDFQQQQHRVTLSGRSAGASRLIGALAARKELRNPTFAAPVTRIEATRSEVFTITAEVTP